MRKLSPELVENTIAGSALRRMRDHIARSCLRQEYHRTSDCQMARHVCYWSAGETDCWQRRHLFSFLEAYLVHSRRQAAEQGLNMAERGYPESPDPHKAGATQNLAGQSCHRLDLFRTWSGGLECVRLGDSSLVVEQGNMRTCSAKLGFAVFHK